MPNFDIVRLRNIARATGRTQSELARDAILRVLDELEQEQVKRLRAHRLLSGLTPSARQAILSAEQEAASIDSINVIGDEHLLLALCADTTHSVAHIMAKFGFTYKIVQSKVQVFTWDKRQASKEHPPYTDRFLTIVRRARKIVDHLKDKRVETEHLFLSLLAQESGTAYEVLDVLAVDREELRIAIRKERALSKGQRAKKRKRGGADSGAG